MDAALVQMHIVGLNTNVQFLRHVVQSPSFINAQLDTALIPREAAVLFQQERVGLPLAAAAVVAHTLAAERASAGTDPFSRRDGWNSHGLRTRRFALSFQGELVEAELRYLHDGALVLQVQDAAGPLHWSPSARDSTALDVQFNQQRFTFNVYKNGDEALVFTEKGATKIIVIDAVAHAGEVAAEGGRLTAPMPGKVVSFSVKAGAKVRQGQALAVMEAMKMEHTIAAPADGVVVELLYAPGDQVTEGAALLTLGALEVTP
jgi:3-methylcrotonyl-CoA carboxylase alpha subunit